MKRWGLMPGGKVRGWGANSKPWLQSVFQKSSNVNERMPWNMPSWRYNNGKMQNSRDAGAAKHSRQEGAITEERLKQFRAEFLARHNRG